MRSTSNRARALAFCCLTLLPAACGGGGGSGQGEMLAIVSAFPAEMAAVLDHTQVEATTTIDGRTFRVGRFGGARVVVAMTGIGLVNAADTTRLLLEHFAVSGVVVSAVAGSPLLVGDVTVPASWVLDDGSAFAATPAWLEVAAQVAGAGRVDLESCAVIPDGAPFDTAPAGARVCLADQPRVVVGGYGTSSDPYGGKAFACLPNGTDVFACDSATPKPFAGVSAGGGSAAALVEVDAGTQTAYDMETAAIAREVTARGLPFVAFRGSSDGGSDPLGLSGFVQFFAYYRLAAHNAAAAAEAFVARLR